MGAELTNAFFLVVSLAGSLGAAWLYRMAKCPANATPAAPLRSISARLSRRIWLALFWANVVVLALGVSFAAYRYALHNATLGAQVQIEAFGPLVARVETLHGHANGVPPGYAVWIVVRSRASNRFYPQEPVEMYDDGMWRARVVFGNEADAGKQFDLFVVIADLLAETTFKDYLARARNNSYVAGLAVIPSTARVLATMSVRRQD